MSRNRPSAVTADLERLAADPLIFLDVDGVLNDHDHGPLANSTTIHRGKVDLLNAILEETDARIVLSSAWRYLLNRNDMTLSGLDWLMRSHGLKAGMIIGITHPDTPVEWDEEKGEPSRVMENERCLQVRRWRARHGHIGPYVVIDDMDLGFTASGMPFVRTHGNVGLTPSNALCVVEILKGQAAS